MLTDEDRIQSCWTDAYVPHPFAPRRAATRGVAMGWIVAGAIALVVVIALGMVLDWGRE